MRKNRVLKAMIFGGELSLCLMDTTEMVNRAIEIHKLSPLSAAALGRSMTAATFMASTLKNESDKLSVTISGDGVGGQIVVCGNSALDMRGYIDNPRAELPLRPDGKLNVGGCVGKNGRLTVVKSMGLKEPYTGSCRLVSGEIAEDFAAYYLYSEQQPTALALGVKIGVDYRCVGAGGAVIQALPGASEENIARAEEAISRLGNISSLIESADLACLLRDYFGCERFEETEAHYRCLCSREYIESILLSMGESELYDILDEQGKISVGCQFCNTEYVFDRSDVDRLLGKNER